MRLGIDGKFSIVQKTSRLSPDSRFCVRRSQRAYIIGMVASIAAVIMGIIGLVRLIKWVWDGLQKTLEMTRCKARLRTSNPLLPVWKS